MQLAIVALFVVTLVSGNMLPTPPMLPESFSANVVVFDVRCIFAFFRFLARPTHKRWPVVALFIRLPCTWPSCSQVNGDHWAGSMYMSIATQQRRIDLSTTSGIVVSIYTDFKNGMPEPYETIIGTSPPTNDQFCVQGPTLSNDTLWQRDSLQAFSFVQFTSNNGDQQIQWVNNDDDTVTTVWTNQDSGLPEQMSQVNGTNGNAFSVYMAFGSPTIPDGIFTLPSGDSDCPKHMALRSAEHRDSIDKVRAALARAFSL